MKLTRVLARYRPILDAYIIVSPGCARGGGRGGRTAGGGSARFSARLCTRGASALGVQLTCVRGLLTSGRLLASRVRRKARAPSWARARCPRIRPAVAEPLAQRGVE